MSTAPLHRPLTDSFSRRAYSRDSAWFGSRTTDGVTEITRVTWWCMFLASSAALLTSIYLAWSSLTSSPVAGCSGGSVFDCSHVLHSRWSSVLSVPVSVPAIATHGLILSMLCWAAPTARMSQIRWRIIGFAAMLAGGAALWFTALQIFALGHLCKYCLVAHFGGIVVATAFLLSRPVSTSGLKWITLAATGSLAGLIGLQLAVEPPPTHEIITYDETYPAEIDAVTPGEDVEIGDDDFFAPPASADLHSSFEFNIEQWQSKSLPRLVNAIANPATLLLGQVEVTPEKPKSSVTILNGVKLHTDAWPLVGDPDAKMVFVEMFDYTCPHCRETHRSLTAARKHFGNDLAMVALPVPMDRSCNSTVQSTGAEHHDACNLAKLAIAVWLVDHAEFDEFHDYLFDSQPSYADAMNRANTIVDKDKLQGVLQSSVPTDYISKHVSLYKRAGSGTIPKLLFPRTTTVGAVTSPQTMIDMIEKYL